MIKTIDIKKEKYLLFVDTETIGSLFMKESVMPFEIGIKVYDTENKKVVKEKSYIVRKFFNNKYIMFSTFSATKYPNYMERINSDKRFKNASANDISRDIQKTIERYNIKVMVAHNGNFDKDACKRLFEEFGTENPFRKLDLLDTMEISKNKEENHVSDFKFDRQRRHSDPGERGGFYGDRVSQGLKCIPPVRHERLFLRRHERAKAPGDL